MNYKELKEKAIEASKPRYDEKSGGIFIPALGIILDINPLSESRCNWYKAMDMAKDAGKRLPTIDELRYIYFYKDAINAIIEEHGGTPFASAKWSSTEYSIDFAWYANFFSGGAGGSYKCGTHIVQAVADV